MVPGLRIGCSCRLAAHEPHRLRAVALGAA
jgi:hypothetical protein